MNYSYKVPLFGNEIVDQIGMAGPVRFAQLAEIAAEDFHSNHNGWECSWPLDFVILREDGSEVGTYSVDRESVPVFYAYEVKV